MRSQAKTLLLTALASLLLVGLLAPAAGAALYTAQRPGFKIDFKTKGHRITKIGFQIPVHCSKERLPTGTGSVGYFGTGYIGSIPINRETGRFRKAIDGTHASEAPFLVRIRGRVHANKITGAIWQKSQIPAPPRHCNTGNYAGWYGDPTWLHFVARRQVKNPPGHRLG